MDYSKVKAVVRRAMCGEIENVTPARIVYVKGLQKTEWLREILGDALQNTDLSIETMDAEFDEIGRLENLDTTGALRCEVIGKIVLWKMFVKCITGGQSAKKN